MKMTTFAGFALVALVGAAVAGTVWADTDAGTSTSGFWGWCPGMSGQGGGYGMGRGAGMGPGYGRGSGYGMGAGQGYGMGQRGNGPHRNAYGMGAGQGGGVGQMLMSPEERVAHQQKIFQSRTLADCQKAQSEEQALMAARAKEKGVTFPGPRQDVCQIMKDRGLIK